MDRPFPAYKDDEPYVFVSYAHSDSSSVYPELVWLKECGLNIWYDEGIEAGTEWREELGQAILNAGLFLFFVTPESVQRENCRKELNLAVEEHIPVLAVHLEHTDLPAGLKLTLSDRQAILKYDIPKAEYQQKIQASITTRVGQPTQLEIEPPKKLRRIIGLGLVVVLVIGLILYYQQSPNATDEHSIPDKTATTDGAVQTKLVPLKSIAVLPLTNLSPDPNNAYFAAGIHEEVLNQLAKISDMKVISRRAVLRYEGTTQSPSEIARELGVGYVMEGSVRFAGDNVRITIQLIHIADDTQLWSEPYDRQLDDIFAIQSDVAKRVAEAMQSTLSPSVVASIERPATESTEAYILFLSHRSQLEKERARLTADENGWIKAGIRKMESAIELDPSFARGLAELAFLKLYETYINPSEKKELTEEALRLANLAISIDPTVARAYQVLQKLAVEFRQWDEWEINVRKGLELPDLDGRTAANFALTLFNIGRHQESYQWMDVAISKDPQSSLYRELAVSARIFGQDYETAIELSEQFRASGGDKNVYHAFRAYAFHRLDMQTESLDELHKITTEPMIAGMIAPVLYHDYLRCKNGQQYRVMDTLRNLEDSFGRNFRIQYCALGAGDFDTVFEELQRKMNRERPIEVGNFDFLQEVKDDPRWLVFEEYMNLPEPK